MHTTNKKSCVWGCNPERVCYNVCMRKNNKKKNRTADRWSDADRQSFADRNILKAQTIQGKRFEGADADEWEDWDDEDLWG